VSEAQQTERARRREERRTAYAEYVLNIAQVYQTLMDVTEREDYPGGAQKSQAFRELAATGERLRAELLLIAGPAVLTSEQKYRNRQIDLVRDVFAGRGFTSLRTEYFDLLLQMREDLG
jgi:hypothetical protein